MKPYHLVKPGESLLCPPLIRARQELQAQLVMKPASAVRFVLPPNAQLTSHAAKVDTALKPREVSFSMSHSSHEYRKIAERSYITWIEMEEVHPRPTFISHCNLFGLFNVMNLKFDTILKT